MTQKGRQKFWRMKIDTFFGKVKSGCPKNFSETGGNLKQRESETGGNASLPQGGWPPLYGKV